MPWCKIDPSKLKFIEMFNYQILSQNDEFILAQYDGKIVTIEKAQPWLYFEDAADAMQLGVIGIIQSP